MNDNGQNFSSGPYKATRNLNTMIENPDINVNSATTVNIMESNETNAVQYNNTNNDYNSFNNNLGVDQSSSIVSDALVQNNSAVSTSNSVEDVNLVDNPVMNFINQTSSGFNQNIQNTQDVVESNSNVNNNLTNNVNTNNFGFVDSNSVSNNNLGNQVNSVNSVRYENVYDTDKKKQSKKTVSIPSEFKTAILVVLILLIGVFCFESIYDFFRNLYIFG